MLLFSISLVKVQVMQPYSSTDMVTSRKNSNFILSDRLDFRTVANHSIAIHALFMRALTSFSVDEILLPRYTN